MNCLVVVAHPLEDSLCHYLSTQTIEHLKDKGYTIKVIDLYRRGFQPALTAQERQSYYGDAYDSSNVEDDISQLLAAESLVLVFPTWWFGSDESPHN
ncbi:NAD(P)H-dependent oxidoreductase [Aliagarivorans taiwanensis]|uniref:NAD(P)H-dependent oxidoreductase n=1 Tax=Aliagarivorans taiwanensis TaxID=561966 RepID=UPI00041D81B1|nr:NAD(P)H-dependent oxidoreductase [Aliagarivorans taiwanensis]